MIISDTELREAQLIMLDILKEIDRVCKKGNIQYWLDSGTLLGAIRHKGFIPWDDDLDICMLREDYNKFIEISKEELSKKYFLQSYDSDNKTENMWIKLRDRNSILKINEREKGHIGIFVDIFPMDFYSNNDKNYKIKNKIKLITLMYWMKHAKIKRPVIKHIKGNMTKLIARLIFLFNPKFNYKNIIKLVKKELKNISMESEGSDYINYGVEVPFDKMIEKNWIFPLDSYEFEGEKYPIPREYDLYLKNLYGNYMELPKKENRRPSHCYELKLKLSEDEYSRLNKNYN